MKKNKNADTFIFGIISIFLAVFYLVKMLLNISDISIVEISMCIVFIIFSGLFTGTIKLLDKK